jgi:hypothetical protein
MKACQVRSRTAVVLRLFTDLRAYKIWFSSRENTLCRAAECSLVCHAAYSPHSRQHDIPVGERKPHLATPVRHSAGPLVDAALHEPDACFVDRDVRVQVRVERSRGPARQGPLDLSVGAREFDDHLHRPGRDEEPDAFCMLIDDRHRCLPVVGHGTLHQAWYVANM